MRQMLTIVNTRPHRTTDEKVAALAQLDQQPRVWVRLEDAADAIGRHRSTVYRWYQHDPVFRAAVDSINNRNLDAHRKRLAREQAIRSAAINAKWLKQRQAQAAYARSCKWYR